MARWISDLAGTLRDFTVKGILTVTGVTKLQAALSLLSSSSNPSSPAAGYTYYNNATFKITWFDGTGWQSAVRATDITNAVYDAQFVSVTTENAVVAGFYSGLPSWNFVGNGLSPALSVGVESVAGGVDSTALVVATPGSAGNTFGRYPISGGLRSNGGGTWGSVAMSSGDILFAQPALGDAGSGTGGGGQTGGYWQWVCDGTWSNTHYPTRLELYLCSSSSTTPALAATFKNNGFLANGGANFNIAQAFPGAVTNGNAFLYVSSTLGLVLYGAGSVNDVLIANKSGSTAIAVPTGTVTPVAPVWGSQYVADGTVGSTVSLNFVASNCHSFTLTSATNCTVSVGTAPQQACDVTIKVTAPASGTLPTIAWPANFKGTWTTTFSALGKSHTFRAHYDGTNYLMLGSVLNY